MIAQGRWQWHVVSEKEDDWIESFIESEPQ